MPVSSVIGTSRAVADESWLTIFRVALTDSVYAEVRVPPGCTGAARMQKIRLVRDLLTQSFSDPTTGGEP